MRRIYFPSIEALEACATSDGVLLVDHLSLDWIRSARQNVFPKLSETDAEGADSGLYFRLS